MLNDIDVFKDELTKLYEMLHDNPDIVRFKWAIIDDIDEKSKNLEPKLKTQLYHAAYNHALFQHRHFRKIKDTVNTFFSNHNNKKEPHRKLIETDSQKTLTERLGFGS